MRSKLKTPDQRRGGGPGNTQPMLPGFYARHFKQGELADLDALMAVGVEDEIHMLRVLTRRTMELTDEIRTPSEAAYLLGALGLAAMRTAGLLRTQKLLGDPHDTNAVISQALAEVVKELGLDER